MALITRLSRLFRADLHAVLDRIEEPNVLLRQAVREMEEALTHDEKYLKVLKHENEQMLVRDMNLDRSLREIDMELDLCFESGREDLARTLIRRKLEAQRYRAFLSRKREASEKKVAELKARIEENRVRLDGMRQKAEVLTEDKADRYTENGFGAPDISVREEDVEVAFLSEKQKRSRS